MRSGLRFGILVAMKTPNSPTPARTVNVTSLEVRWNSIAPAVTATKLPNRCPELNMPIILPRMADVPTRNAVSCAASRMMGVGDAPDSPGKQQHRDTASQAV